LSRIARPNSAHPPESVAGDRAVGPAGEQGADEAFCLAVGLRAVGPGARVERAMPSSSAIWAPVDRNLRNAAIASIRRPSVRLATSVGAEERSASQAGPSTR
jgi:hypothetical protein